MSLRNVIIVQSTSISPITITTKQSVMGASRGHALPLLNVQLSFFVYFSDCPFFHMIPIVGFRNKYLLFYINSTSVNNQTSNKGTTLGHVGKGLHIK